MKSRTYQGTPYNSIRSGGAGIDPQKPQGYGGGSQTSRDQFEGSQEMNKKVAVDTGVTSYGTPYQSLRGNPGDFSRTRADDRYGVVLGGDNANLNSPDGAGGSTMFNGISRESGYSLMAADGMDSPVMHGAPAYETRQIMQVNLARLGQGIGAVPAQSGDDIVKIGGVLSRGLVGTSRPTAPERELTEDDTLANARDTGTR